jgi:hypothetical protein
MDVVPRLTSKLECNHSVAIGDDDVRRAQQAIRDLKRQVIRDGTHMMSKPLRIAAKCAESQIDSLSRPREQLRSGRP